MTPIPHSLLFFNSAACSVMLRLRLKTCLRRNVQGHRCVRLTGMKTLLGKACVYYIR